jgi:hypothetical protein
MLAWLKSLFVRDWRQILRRWSVQGLGVLATVQAAWLGLDPQIKAGLSEDFVAWMSLGITVATLLSAFLAQKSFTEDGDGKG